jgi:hypothetical protein
MYALIFKTTQRILMRFDLIDTLIQKEGLCLNDMHNIVQKHLSICIVSVRSRGESLVKA